MKPVLYLIVLGLHLIIGLIPLRANVLKDSVSSFMPRSLALNISSRGYGIEASFVLKKKPYIGLRVNASYFDFKQSQNIKMDKGSSVDIFPDVKTLVFGSLVDYYPFKNKVFRLTGGLSYEVIQNYQVAFSSASGLNLGGLQIASDDFGNINFGMKWNSFRPYIGFGFARAAMKKRLGIGFDMGIAYIGSPKLSLLYEGFLETTTIDEEMKKIEANMSGYSYYPYVALQLKYNLYPVKK